jgi:serine/threonine-protein kinase
MRLGLDLGRDAVAGTRSTAVLSPNGRRLAYLVRGPDGRRRLATRLLEQRAATVLPGTEDADGPFFSPDGESLGFFADYKLKTTPVQGGAPVVVCDAPNPRGASWGEDDNIIFAPHVFDGLFRVPATGGTPQAVTHLLEGEAAHAWPQILPGGDSILFTSRLNPNAETQQFRINILSLRTRQTKVVWRGGFCGRYIGTGHLVFRQPGVLSAVPFDLLRMEARGAPVVLLDDFNDINGLAPQFEVAQNGALIYLGGERSNLMRTLVWIDTSGKTQVVAAGLDGGQISPDRSLIVGHRPSDAGTDLWLVDLKHVTERRLTFRTRGNLWAAWAPDGKHLVFSAVSGNKVGRAIWWMRADGAGEPQPLLELPEEIHPSSISPDGKRIAFHRRTAGTGYDIWILPLDISDPEHPKPGEPELFLRTPSNEWNGVFSPNGRWIAYFSDDGGPGVYVRPSRGPGGPWLVSKGGLWPKWSADGRTLYYSSSDRHIMEVPYSESGESFVLGKSRRWSDAVTVSTPFGYFDMDRNGERILTTLQQATAEERSNDIPVTLLLNFFDEVRRRVPVRRK